MRHTRIEEVKEKLVDVVYNSMCYEFSDMQKEHVSKVINMCAHDIDLSRVMFIQSFVNAWNTMLSESEHGNPMDSLSTDKLIQYNKVCCGNIYASAGNLITDNVKPVNQVPVYTRRKLKPNHDEVFDAVFDTGNCDIKETGVRIYCNIMKLRLFEKNNECVARLAACSYLLMHDAGYFDIPAECVSDIKLEVKKMIQSDNGDSLCAYLMNHAVR